MKIIAISDTHIKDSIHEHLPSCLIALLRASDMIIHAGDFVTKHVYDELSEICMLEGVYGNMDDPYLKDALPERKLIDIEGIRIGVVHEAALSLHDTTGVRYMAKEMGVDILIFGHLHRPLIEKSDVLVVCPGSPTTPTMSEPCAIELIIEDNKVLGRIKIFEGKVCSAIRTARSFMLLY